jgi:hypothetical protein
MNALVREHGKKLVIAEPGWFFPVTIDQAMIAAPYLAAGRHKCLRLLTNHTLGQLPFAAHLWNSNESVDLARAYEEDIDDTPTALLPPYSNPEHAFGCIREGLERLGFRIERKLPLEDSPIMRDPELIICWNGKRPNNTFADLARENHIPCLYMEHGFFQRREFTQADPKGILHWSTWADHMAEEPPAAAYDRLAFHYPEWDQIDFRPRDGYILILGQVPGDSQMMNSEYDAPPAMLQQISRRLPGKWEAVFRPHPFAPPLDPSTRRLYSNITLRETRDTVLYSKDMQASKSLAEDLAGAKFCIAINSNALVEATARGIPCLAFGPALGINAGVYRQTNTRNLGRDMQAMMDGWHPDPERAKAFLAWLAWIQYSRAELADPEVVRCLCQRAGVKGF